MKIQELLWEYDQRKIESLAPLYANRTREPSAPTTTTVTELADHVEKDLGVKNGETVFWIVHRYLKPQSNNQYGIQRWEDVSSRVIPNLRKFETLKLKNKIPRDKRDLNQLKSLSELEALVDQFDEQDLQSQSQEDKAVEKQMYENGDARLIYNDAEIKVVQPLTEKGSCYFGINTKWCTAGKEDNRFASYHKRGPLYIVLIKKENKRYQFHWAEYLNGFLAGIKDQPFYKDVLRQKHHESQFMDEKDNPINPNAIADRYPILYDIFGPIAQKNQSLVLNPNPSLELQKQIVSIIPDQIQYIYNPSSELQILAVAKDPYAIVHISNPLPNLHKLAASSSYS